jgi:hypothetical protein
MQHLLDVRHRVVRRIHIVHEQRLNQVVRLLRQVLGLAFGRLQNQVDERVN